MNHNSFVFFILELRVVCYQGSMNLLHIFSYMDRLSFQLKDCTVFCTNNHINLKVGMI